MNNELRTPQNVIGGGKKCLLGRAAGLDALRNSSRISSVLNASGIRRLFLFLLLSACMYVSLLVLNHNLDYQGFNYFSAQLRRLADAMFFALPVLLMYKKRYLFPYLLIVVVYFLSNLLYYRNYGTLMPLSSYLMWENLNGLGPSIVNSLRWKDIWLFVPVGVFMLFYYWVGLWFVSKRRKIWLWANVGLALLPILAFITPSYIFNHPEAYAHPFGLYRNEPVRAFRQFGFINYYIYQIKSYQKVGAKEKETVRLFMKEYNDHRAKKTNLVQSSRKNLIVILVESLQSWPIGLKVAGTEVTPCLNAIVRDSAAVYFSKVLPQVKGGRSADAQLLLNTGLLPIENGAAASLFGTQNYPSLPEALKGKGYRSLSLITDNKAYWNQEATTKSYHFDELYDRLLQGNPAIRADECLFENGLPILQQTSQPFYAQLVTMSGHDAVQTDLENPFRSMDFKDKQVEYNLIITRYVDACIGNFVKELKRVGLYDNSVVVITGDHDMMTFNRYEGRENVLLSDRFIPFIMLNAPELPVDQEQVIGQMDIYPTLLDVMGVADYYWGGLGESVFRSPAGFAVYHNGETEGNVTNDSLRIYKKNLWKISDLMIRMNYFYNNTL